MKKYIAGVVLLLVCSYVQAATIELKEGSVGEFA
jgi:hypothetical protein